MYGYGSPGANWLNALQTMVTGNVGFFAGLLLVILGLFTLVFKREVGASLLMIAGGALITLSPSVFNVSRQLVADVLATVGGAQNTINP